MGSVREISEGRQEQGSDEEITYTVTIPTTWGTPTGTPTVKVYSFDGDFLTDVTSTAIPAGSASVASQVITLPEIKSLVENITYLVHTKFSTSQNNDLSFNAWIDCKR